MEDYNYHGESFLNRLYKDLHMNDEVMHTASSSDTKDEKVKKYLDRLEKVEKLAKNSKHNGIELLKEMYYKKYVIKPENVPESYFETQKKIALERGFGHVEISGHEKKMMIDTIIQDQKKSLDIWLDYLISSDVKYPEWFKYYAFQGMLKLGSYDKKKESFNKRTSSTTNVFVDLNREALALVYDNLCNVLSGQKVDDDVLQGLLQNGSFAKIYSYMLKRIDSNKKNISDSNDGVWIKYNQGSEPDELVKSLEGKGTGWCTAGIETARTQLQGGDFYVYYTKDSNGEYKQPRIAIRMEGNSIAEVRGISEHQNLESELEEILDKKLEEFPDSDNYNKKVKDMEILTKIYRDYKNRELTIDELRFLYEIDVEIEGFGYDKDPRIEEILLNRNFKKDLSKVFSCSEDQISNNKQDVLDGKKIIYFYGDLNLSNLTSVEGLILPDNVGGTLNLNSLRSIESLILPNSVRGSLCLFSLFNIENLTLPNRVGGFLDLSNLTNAEGLILPKSIGWDLDLSSLTDAKDITFPNSIGCGLYLSSLISATNLILPNSVGATLDLGYLTNVENLTLPNRVDGSLNLESLTNVENLILPETVGKSLYLNSLTSVTDLILPNSVGSHLNLKSLTSAKNLTLPNTIGGFLMFTRLTSTEGLIVPKNFNYKYIQSDYITIEDLKVKSLENNEKKLSKKLGFSKISMLIIINILISIGFIFLGIFFVV